MIERSGVKTGGKIVAGYVRDYLKSFFIGAGDILFITGGIGDKAHYRAFGVAEELRLHGFLCAVTVADNFQVLKYAHRFKIFVFHKVTVNKKIAEFLAEIKKQKKEIIFDTDDLDFDPKYLSQMDYFSQITAVEKQEYEKGIGAEIVNDPYVKVATTTVSYLADKLKEKGKRVFVVSNKISLHELEIAEKIIKEKKPRDGFVRIGYYSGTLSHNKDFASVVPAMLEILEKNEHVKLILAGPLDTESKLNKFKNRIERLPRVPRDEYYANVYKCDINIVPLELDNPFCESRSEIKFTAAGILGIPTVAVGNQTHREAISDGLDGFLASTKEEWVEKITRLIKDENLRREIGQRARKKTLRDYTNRNSHSGEYYAYLRKILDK